MKIFLCACHPPSAASDRLVCDAILHWTSSEDRIIAKHKLLDLAHAPPKEISIRVQVQGTTVMAIHEVQGNTLVSASADFGNAQVPPTDAQPGEIANKLLQTLAEAAMI